MNWLKLSTVAAARRFDELKASEIFSPSELPPEYRDLRKSLLTAITDFSVWKDGPGAYDIESGLAIYKTLNELSFNMRAASDEGVWRHLSLNVIPDRVEGRWSDRQEQRFWRGRSRIWLRSLWWFTHLTWQGSESATRSALKNITTDDIVQLIERPGRQGFRIELCRALFRARSARPVGQTKFRELMVLNTARLMMTAPELYSDGLDGFARSLYETIDVIEKTSISSIRK